jgi:hypothetical protein
MIGGAPVFMPEEVPFYPQTFQPAPATPRRVPPPSVVRGVSGSERAPARARASSGPLAIPTPQQLGIAPKASPDGSRVRTGPAPSGPLAIPTPAELGVAVGQRRSSS